MTARAGPPATGTRGPGRASRPELDRVARVYNTTAAMGYPARDEVAHRLGLRPGPTGRMVREAHRAGLIPVIQRRPHRKIIAVADALDVTPAELALAITEHAGGTLTITNHTLTNHTTGGQTP